MSDNSHRWWSLWARDGRNVGCGLTRKRAQKIRRSSHGRLIIRERGDAPANAKPPKGW